MGFGLLNEEFDFVDHVEHSCFMRTGIMPVPGLFNLLRTYFPGAVGKLPVMDLSDAQAHPFTFAVSHAAQRAVTIKLAHVSIGRMLIHIEVIEQREPLSAPANF